MTTTPATTTINGRIFTVTERITDNMENIKKVNPGIVAMVMLTGVRGAAKMAFEYTDGTFDIISSL
jgi:hypothetical protein